MSEHEPEPPIELQPAITAPRDEVLRLIERTHQRALHRYYLGRPNCPCDQCVQRNPQTRSPEAQDGHVDDQNTGAT